jgi:parvulin-like peptidyl-prolyl isomerase
MIACAACVAGAGFAIAGGPATLIVAVNAPGSAVAVMACAAACYEAFQ